MAIVISLRFIIDAFFAKKLNKIFEFPHNLIATTAVLKILIDISKTYPYYSHLIFL